MRRSPVLLFSVFLSSLNADVQLSSWMTDNAGKYARVYETISDRDNVTAGSTTWSGTTLPSYADIQSIYYSDDYVYVEFSGLASYVMGPSLNPQGNVGQLWPANQKGTYRIPRDPIFIGTPDAAYAGSVDASGTPDGAIDEGYVGLWLNGTAAFGAGDGQNWNGTDVDGTTSTEETFWHRMAPVGEAFNFDYSLGHQTAAGTGNIYHTHQNPRGLRYQLGGSVADDGDGILYEVLDTDGGFSGAHSPIIGWANDGFPIYGPYGYSDPTDAESAVRRMTNCFVRRNTSNAAAFGCEDLNVADNLDVIPIWYAQFREAKYGESYGAYSVAERTVVDGTGGTGSATRPAVDSDYPIDTFGADWESLDALGLSQYDGSVTFDSALHYDLDESNARFCVTPEFPSGTYAYFVSIDSSGEGVFPYTVGPFFKGDSDGNGEVNAIAETVTTYFRGGENAAPSLNSLDYNSGSDEIVIVWNATEGATYKIETSTDLESWADGTTDLTAEDITDTVTESASADATFYRVTRTSIASYDPSTTYDPDNPDLFHTFSFNSTLNFPEGSIDSATLVNTSDSGDTVSATVATYTQGGSDVTISVSSDSVTTGVTYELVMVFSTGGGGTSEKTSNNASDWTVEEEVSATAQSVQEDTSSEPETASAEEEVVAASYESEPAQKASPASEVGTAERLHDFAFSGVFEFSADAIESSVLVNTANEKEEIDAFIEIYSPGGSSVVVSVDSSAVTGGETYDLLITYLSDGISSEVRSTPESRWTID